MNVLNYYSSIRLLLINKMEPGAPIPLDGLTQQYDRPGGFKGLFQWLGSDQRELDPEEINRELHTSTKILLDEELSWHSRLDVIPPYLQIFAS
jgi:hypothetical protein